MGKGEVEVEWGAKDEFSRDYFSGEKFSL